MENSATTRRADMELTPYHLSGSWPQQFWKSWCGRATDVQLARRQSSGWLGSSRVRRIFEHAELYLDEGDWEDTLAVAVPSRDDGRRCDRSWRLHPAADHAECCCEGAGRSVRRCPKVGVQLVSSSSGLISGVPGGTLSRASVSDIDGYGWHLFDHYPRRKIPGALLRLPNVYFRN